MSNEKKKNTKRQIAIEFIQLHLAWKRAGVEALRLGNRFIFFSHMYICIYKLWANGQKIQWLFIYLCFLVAWKLFKSRSVFNVFNTSLKSVYTFSVGFHFPCENETICYLIFFCIMIGFCFISFRNFHHRQKRLIVPLISHFYACQICFLSFLSNCSTPDTFCSGYFFCFVFDAIVCFVLIPIHYTYTFWRYWTEFRQLNKDSFMIYIYEFIPWIYGLMVSNGTIFIS